MIPYQNTQIAAPLAPQANNQRDAITQALMNVQNPPPRTQVPGGGMPGTDMAGLQPPPMPDPTAPPASPSPMPGAGGGMSPAGAPPMGGMLPGGAQQLPGGMAGNPGLAQMSMPQPTTPPQY